MHEKNRFDSMMIDIGTHMFDAQRLLSQFILEILYKLNSNIYDINIPFPYNDNGNYIILFGEKLNIDHDSEKMYIITSDNKRRIEWTDLDLSIQDLIANQLHMDYVSGKIFNRLTGKEILS